MGVKKLHFLFFLAVIAVISCGSNPKNEEWQDFNAPANKSDETFDVSGISEEYYRTTKEDVQHIIEGLNESIRKKDYEAWKAALSNEYFAGISSPENLVLMSEQPAMKTRKIVLKTAEDYFINVVVPSRANSRVDDIEFVNRERVKAFTININKAGEEQKLRLYDLEKINNTWKIIN